MPRPSRVPRFLDPNPSEVTRIYKALSAREHLRRTSPASAYSTETGTSRDNVYNNRYRDIIAYDPTRVRLHACPDFYVNASVIVEPDLGFPPDLVPRRTWVAAQGPTAQTVPSFLELLLERPVSSATETDSDSLVNVIVQLTPLVEHDREKCAPYFPSDRPGEQWEWDPDDREDGGNALGGVWVRYEGRAPGEVDAGERRSWLQVGRAGDDVGRRVLHVEYLGWRDHGVPASSSHLVSFINRINSLNASLARTEPRPPSSPATTSTGGPATPLPPILVHCSAGVGRTGTYIAISSLLPLVSLIQSDPTTTLSSTTLTETTTKANKANEQHPLGSEYPFATVFDAVPDEAVAVHEANSAVVVDFVGLTVDRVRDQRTTMVQTRDQLAFVYDALRTAWIECESESRGGGQ